MDINSSFGACQIFFDVTFEVAEVKFAVFKMLKLIV